MSQLINISFCKINSIKSILQESDLIIKYNKFRSLKIKKTISIYLCQKYTINIFHLDESFCKNYTFGNFTKIKNYNFLDIFPHNWDYEYSFQNFNNIQFEIFCRTIFIHKHKTNKFFFFKLTSSQFCIKVIYNIYMSIVFKTKIICIP